jgi:hypothetical protein
MAAMSRRLLDPKFKWIPSQTHDADSTAFRDRQMARIAEADKARKAVADEATAKVKQITQKRKA